MPEKSQTFYATRLKRVLDIAGSLLLIGGTSPIQALCAAAIVMDDGRPIWFNHLRVGKDGRTFSVHKFRTMTVGTNLIDEGYPTPAMVTGVGRVLRRWSLDELPQLMNILRGDMSFVGPRPAIPSQVERYTDLQRGRLSVRPGLTGLAQVRHRNNAPWSRRIATDLEYVRRQSFLSDLLIVVRTIPVALRGEGLITGQSAADVDDLGAQPVEERVGA